MATTLSDLQPIRKTNLVVVPTFVAGKLKDAVLPAYLQFAGTNPNFAFKDVDGDVPKGSNVFIAGGLNHVLRDSRFRVAVPTDDIYRDVHPLLENQFYADLNALDVREKKPSYKKNNGLWKKVIELAKASKEGLKFPFRVQGFYCAPDTTKEDYQSDLIPAPNFRIIEDERLNLASGTRFDSLDGTGMINPSENGRYKWYSREDGLSRVYLGRDVDLYSYDDDLADSYDFGRVVVVSSEESD